MPCLAVFVFIVLLAGCSFPLEAEAKRQNHNAKLQNHNVVPCVTPTFHYRGITINFKVKGKGIARLKKMDGEVKKYFKNNPRGSSRLACVMDALGHSPTFRVFFFQKRPFVISIDNPKRGGFNTLTPLLGDQDYLDHKILKKIVHAQGLPLSERHTFIHPGVRNEDTPLKHAHLIANNYGRILDTHEITELLLDKKWMILSCEHVHEKFFNLTRVCGDAFGFISSINVEVTPMHNAPLSSPLHTERVDKFVFQTEGKKRIKIFHPSTNFTEEKMYPIFDEVGMEKHFERTLLQMEQEVGDVVYEDTLNVGDILYVPRGFPHATSTFATVDHATQDPNKPVYSTSLSVSMYTEAVGLTTDKLVQCIAGVSQLDCEPSDYPCDGTRRVIRALSYLPMLRKTLPVGFLSITPDDEGLDVECTKDGKDAESSSEKCVASSTKDVGKKKRNSTKFSWKDPTMCDGSTTESLRKVHIWETKLLRLWKTSLKHIANFEKDHKLLIQQEINDDKAREERWAVQTEKMEALSEEERIDDAEDKYDRFDTMSRKTLMKELERMLLIQDALPAEKILLDKLMEDKDLFSAFLGASERLTTVHSDVLAKEKEERRRELKGTLGNVKQAKIIITNLRENMCVSNMLWRRRQDMLKPFKEPDSNTKEPIKGVKLDEIDSLEAFEAFDDYSDGYVYEEVFDDDEGDEEEENNRVRKLKLMGIAGRQKTGREAVDEYLWSVWPPICYPFVGLG